MAGMSRRTGTLCTAALEPSIAAPEPLRGATGGGAPPGDARSGAGDSAADERDAGAGVSVVERWRGIVIEE